MNTTFTPSSDSVLQMSLPNDLSNHLNLFQERFTFIRELREKNSHYKIDLFQDQRSDLFIVKQYVLSETSGHEEILFYKHIEKMAQNEYQISQLIDHPNCLKIHEVLVEESSIYIIMNYIEGQFFDDDTYSPAVKITFMQQLLDIYQHLLSKNMILDHFLSKNIWVSHQGTQLVLADLSGIKLIEHRNMWSIGHYLDMFENVVIILGGVKAIEILDKYTYFISAELRKESMSPMHVREMSLWISAMQKELKDTIIH